MYIDLTPSTVPIFGFFSFALRDTDVSLMNFCNECVSTLDDTPTILIRENNCWESIRARVTVLNYYKEGIRYFLRWASGFIYLLGTILISINAWTLTVNTVNLYALYSARRYFAVCFPSRRSWKCKKPRDDDDGCLSINNREKCNCVTRLNLPDCNGNSGNAQGGWTDNWEGDLDWQSTIVSFYSIAIF